MSGEKSRLVILDEWHGNYKITKGNWERMKQPRLFEPEEIINSRSRQMQ